MATPIGTIGLIPNLVVDGTTFTDLTNILFLSGFTSPSSGSNFYATLRLNIATSGHQIATGKNFIPYAVVTDGYSSSGTGTINVQLAATGSDVGQNFNGTPGTLQTPPGSIDVILASGDFRGTSRSFAPIQMAYNLFGTTFPTMQIRVFGSFSGNLSHRIYAYEM